MLSLLTSLLQSHVEEKVSRGIKGLGSLAVIALFLLTAYGAAVAALALFLTEHTSPWMAAAFMALGFALMAGGVLLVRSLAGEAERRRAEAVAQARQEAREEMLSALTGASGGGRQAAVIAAIAGLVLSSLLGKDGDDGED
ncbi:MAG: phage holin family protein [Hyphomonas sp.]